MNLFQNLKERAKTFISGPSAFRIQDKISAKVITIAGIIPKKAIPRQLVDRISKPLGVESEETQQGIVAEKKVVSSLGKLTLDLIQVNNNLEKIVEIIQEDYKNTKHLNKKETEDYRKRIANRFRVIGGRELKSSKVDVTNLVKNFAGSFFKGIGGALRALSAFNFIDALMRGDPAAAVGALLGMASTYLPAIIGGVVGGITSSIFGGIKNLFKGGKTPKVPTTTPVAPTKPTGPKKLPGLGKYGKMLALGTSALALGSAFGLGNKQEENQSRLEDLTQQQKGLVTPDKLVPIPQDDLKKFENLNKKFERAIDFLLGKQKEQDNQPKPRKSGGGGGGGGGSPTSPITMGPGVEGLANFIAGAETGGRFDAYSGDSGQGDSRIPQMTLSELKSKYSGTAVGAYQFMPDTAIGIARQMGMDPSKTVFTPDVQKQLHIFHLNQLGYSDYVSGKITKEQFGSNIAQQYRALPVPGTGATYQDQYASRNRALRTDAQFLQALELSKTGATTTVPSPPILPPTQTLSQQPAQPRPVPSPQISSAPRRRQPPATPQARTSPTIIPMPIVQPEPQVPLASTVDQIDSIPNFETSYSENFLTMYSKLIYQIV